MALIKSKDKNPLRREEQRIATGQARLRVGATGSHALLDELRGDACARARRSRVPLAAVASEIRFFRLHDPTRPSGPPVGRGDGPAPGGPGSRSGSAGAGAAHLLSSSLHSLLFLIPSHVSGCSFLISIPPYSSTSLALSQPPSLSHLSPSALLHLHFPHSFL